ncbi:MAG: hypothetical protein ACD_22C00072G0009 [uncultured bacterium]|nr:MAG: hypothetical protein ACD_22C00072G0009 [uncultured bacterium]
MSKRLFKLTMDSLMLVMLFGILMLPISSLGWMRVKNQTQEIRKNVLPASTIRNITEEPSVSSTQSVINETTQTTQSTSKTK